MAKPANNTSLAFNLWPRGNKKRYTAHSTYTHIYMYILHYRIPVNARYIPRLPVRRGRKYDPPASGNSPMKVSGIANSVCSVATPKSPCTDILTPCEWYEGGEGCVSDW